MRKALFPVFACASAVALCGLLAVTEAQALRPYKGTALALANEGIDMYRAHNYKGALEKLQAAESLAQAPMYLVYIARCQVELGQLVEGAESYRALARTNLEPGAPEASKKAVTEGKDELAALLPKLPSVRILVTPEGTSISEVRIDGESAPPAIVGVESPIDPGHHHLRVAAGGAPTEVDFDVATGEKKQVPVLVVPGSGGAEGAAVPAAAAGASASSDAPEAVAPKDENPSSFFHGSKPRRHDGFFLRAAVGGGAMSDKFDVEVAPLLGIRAIDGTAKGPTASGQIDAGGSLRPGLVLGLSLAIEQAASPKVQVQGQDTSSVSVGTFTLFGGMIEWYPKAEQGFHLGAVVGVARLTMSDTSGQVSSNQPVGVSGAADVGYEVWLGDEWSLGASLRGLGGSLSDNGIHHEIVAGSVLVNVTYH